MPQLRVNAVGTTRVPSVIRANDGGAVRTVKRIRVNDNGVIRTVFQFFTASLSTTLVSGNYNGASAAAQDITTSSVSALAAGGTGPFTYAWTRTDGGPDAWTILSPTSATTAFKATGVPAGTQAIGSFECTITDSTPATATTASVQTEANNNSTA